MRPYPIELRQRVFDAYEAGEGSIEAVAVRFKVSPGFVKKLLRHHRQTGSLQPRPHGGGNPRAIDEQGEAALLALLAEKNDRILIELTVLLAERYGIHASLSSVNRALHRMGITPKKKTLRPTEQDRLSVQAERDAYQQALAIELLARFVFVDESGFQVGMTRIHARAPRGQRARGRVLRNRGRNLTLLAGITPDGVLAPMLIEGGTDRHVFLAYLDHVLIPNLRPFQIVIMDNLGAHHAIGVRERIEAAGCSVLFLPPYSPDLNPIEMLFSKLKTLVRGLAHRTHQTLTHAIAQVLQSVTPDDCRGWFDHAGYPNKPGPLN